MENQSSTTALELAAKEQRCLQAAGLERFPALIARAGQKASFRFVDNPLVIAAYIEQHSAAAPTGKQHLAALRMLFDWLAIGQIMPVNPASSVRGPKHVVRKGKTPVLSLDETRTLLESIKCLRS